MQFPLFSVTVTLSLRGSTQRSNAHTEKLIQVVGINAEEPESLQQRNILALRFQQDAVIEIHPTYIPFHIGKFILFILLTHTF